MRDNDFLTYAAGGCYAVATRGGADRRATTYPPPGHQMALGPAGSTPKRRLP